MKYVLSGLAQSNLTKKADILRYPYSLINKAIEDVHNSNKILLIEIKDDNINFDKLYEYQQTLSNLYFDFYSINALAQYDEYLPKDAPHKYMYHYYANTWNIINLLKYHHASDILITEPLTFKCDEIIKYIHPYFTVHIVPHMPQQDIMIGVTDPINHFWVLPQHLKMYEGIFDVVEIADPREIREATLFTVYAIDKEYNLMFNSLFEHMTTLMPASWVQSEWAQKRMNCKQICMKDPNACHYCRLEKDSYQIAQKRYEETHQLTN